MLRADGVVWFEGSFSRLARVGYFRIKDEIQSAMFFNGVGDAIFTFKDVSDIKFQFVTVSLSARAIDYNNKLSSPLFHDASYVVQRELPATQLEVGNAFPVLGSFDSLEFKAGVVAIRS